MNKQLLKGMRGKLIFLFALGSFLLSNNLSATHIVGGGLTYKCLGGDQYEITLNVYRDCFFGASNAPFDAQASIGIFDGTTGFRLDEVRIPLGPQNDTLDVVIADTCLFVPATVCVHTTTYVQVVTLPQRPTGYTLAYQRCCRNQTILNIVNPLETGATFVSEISGQALTECNNQATYNNFPPLFICVNEPIDFDHSATDVDGDSLVYKLCAPFDGATLENPQPQPPSSPPYNQVVYDPPFSLSNVLGGDPLTIDPNTGFITGVPNNIGQYVVGVCVEEYRNGVLISETRRDFQYNVGQCGIVEAIIGNAGTLCNDLTANFINNSTNSGTFTWDFGDPTTTSDVSTDFQPSYTYPDTGIYNVMLTVEIGSECEDILNFPLYVKNTTVQPAFDLVTFECENGDIIVAVQDNSFDPDSRFDVTGWNWTLSDGQFSDEQHPVFVVSNDGQDITVTLEVESSDTCSDSISQTVSPGDNNLGSLTSPSTICDGQSVELYPEYLSQNPNLTYSWSPGTNLNSTSIANPIANPTTTTTYTLTVNAPGTGCTALIDKLVNVGDFTDLGIQAVLTDSNGNQTTVDGGSGNVIVCDGQSTTLTVMNSASMISTVEWLDPNGAVISNNVTLTVNPDGSTTYTVNVVDENGCNGSSQITLQPSSVDISIQEIDNPGSGSGITDVDGDGILDLCVGESSSLNVFNQNSGDQLTYLWTVTSGDAGIISSGGNSSNPSLFGLADGFYTLSLEVTNQFGCNNISEVVINVHDNPDLNIQAVLTDDNGNQTVVDGDGNNVILCNDQSTTLTVSNSSSSISNVIWQDGNGNVVSNDVNATVNPDGTTTYTVSVTNEFGCSNSDQITLQPASVEVSIEEIDNPGSGSGITDIDGDGTLDLCAGETTSLSVVNLNPSNQLTYQWTATAGVITAGANSPNPTIFGLAEGIYTLVLNTTNEFGCSNQNEVLISVHDITDLEIQTTITDLGDNTNTTVNGEDEIINCEGDNSTIILSETATSNNGNVTITWTDQNGNVIGTGPTVDISPFGDATYTVTVMDQFGCSRSEEVTILGNPVDITISESTTGGGNGDELTDTDGDGDLDLCIGLSGNIDVSNNNAGDELTYQWTGTVITGGANTANPSISASSPGQHLLTLTTTNQYGCSRMDLVDVDIFDPNASLDFTTEQDCAGTTIDFASGNTNFEFYIWDFGDGPGSTLTGVQSPSYTFSEPGVYEVTQMPLPGLPCDLPTLTTVVEVAETLVDINFEVEYIDCTPESVTIRFTDVTVTQIGSITGREWIFGDGQTSTAINPVITVTQEGAFTAILNVLNSANCDGAATQTFDINFIDVSGLAEEIIACPLEGPVSLNSSPDDNLTYFWFPDTALDDPNSPNPTANPVGTTTYTVRITDDNGIDVCELERMVTVIVPDVIGLDIDAEGTSSGEIVLNDDSNSNTIVSCEAETITLTSSTTTGTINDFDVVWTDSNGNVISNTGSISVMPGATETFTILVTDDFGCTESSMVTIEGGPVDISIDETFITGGDGNGIGGILNDDGFLELCTGQSFDIAVNNLDPVDELTYTWTGDNQIIVAGINTNSPTINSNTAGTFVLFLETENQFGCTQNDTIDINVIDSNADLSFDEIKDCNGVTVLFTNTSSGVNDDYIWSFGDPSNPNASSSDINPNYTYPGVGSFVVTLGLNTQVTCVDDFVQEVDIVSPILASSFSYDYINCSENGVSIQFSDQSVNPQDNTNGYLWDFGNGMTSTEQNPILNFDDDEELNVSLTIFTEIDCESISQVQNIVISIIDDIQAPASILACENDGPQQIDLNANPNYVYEWSPATGLDDPTSPNPIADPGVSTTYTVTITDIFGSQPCSTVRTIEVFVPESIELTVPDDFETDCGDEANLTVDSPNADLEYEWTLDGEVLGNESTLELDGLSGPGVYVVTATDENGCQETASVTVTGTQLDVEVGNIQYLCEDESGELNVIISNDPNDILEINWIGPNIISGGNTATPTISTEDAIETVYTVEIVNQFGCGTSEEVTVIVLDNDPVGDFINFGQCEGLTISFFNGSPNAPFYIWDFGDGSPTVNEANPMHTYPSPGDYVVTLSLPNEADCANSDIASFTLPIIVEDGINFFADFDVAFAQCDDEGLITFTDMSSSSNQGTIVDWDWEFSTGDTSDEQNPSIMVGDNKVIGVTLTVTTDANCTTSTTREVPIELIDTQVQLEDQLSCIDLVAELNPNANENFTYNWEPAIGLSDPNSPNPTVTASSTTVYSVTITNEEQGCTSVQSVTLTVPEEIDLSVTDDINGCEEVNVNIGASSDVASTMYEWTLDGQVVSTDANFEAQSGRPNVYTVLATDEFGCQETETVTIANFEVLAGLGTNEQTLCLGNSTLLEISIAQSNTDVLEFDWDNSDLDLSDPSAPVANPTETTLYQVVVSNEFGCSITESVLVDVVDIDDGIGDALADPDTIFLGNSTQLAVNDIDGLNYDWTFGGTLDNDNISDPLASPTEDTEYTVTITDDNGCITTRTVPVVVLNRACDEPFIFFPNAFSPNGDGENDVLRARAKDSFVDEVYWIVYSRWGERVFEANSLNEVWDGTFNGELVSPDAYGYYLRINCTDGDVFEKRGNVTVLR